MTAVLTVSVILFGVLSYMQLPVNDLPAVDYPVIQVEVDYPGASPETMANNVATPLERQFMQINGLELVTSKSTQGHTSLTLQFVLEKSIDAAATDVQTAITQATGSLPVDLPSPPTFSKTNPNDQPILYIALTSDSITRGQLYDYANTQVGQRISILPGVSQVAVYGTKAAVRIKADPSKMWARGITVDDLALAIRNGTSYVGAGQFDSSAGTVLLRPKGQLESAQAYGNLIVSARNGAPVYLRDVARVEDSVQDERINMRFWAPRLPRSVGHCRRRRLSPGRRQRGGGGKERTRLAAGDQRGTPWVDTRHADLRSLADHRQQRRGRAGDTPHRVRPGGAGNLSVSRAGHGHADSGRGTAAVALAHFHGHANARLQPRQPVAHGAHAGHRVPG